jgi:small multidrug resistance family-3 protein
MEALVRATFLFVVTAIAEIVGCYLPFLWLRRGRTPLLAVGGAASLALFVWLLTLHPTGAARTYAAYGAVYVAVAMGWLWIVEGERLRRTDVIGAIVMLVGMAIIVLGHNRPE